MPSTPFSRLDNLKGSLEQDRGFLDARPLLINSYPGRENIVIAGNMRLRAAQELGREQLPVLVVSVPPDIEAQWDLKDNNQLERAHVHTTLPASDIERATTFYTTQVGAIPVDSAPGGRFFTIGETRFLLYPTPNANRGGHTQMGISVTDVDAAVRELRGRGVTFEEYDMPGFKTAGGIAETAGGRAAWFKDTEGNTIGLIQLRQ